MNASDIKGKQGTWKYYTRNREIFLEINYENDVKNGPCIKYYAQSGGIREEINYYFGEKDGEYKSYYFNGDVKTEGSFIKNKRNGHWIFYHNNTGEKSSEGDYSNGKKVAEWIYYSRSGEILSKGNFVNDAKDGIWHFYDRDGKEISTQKFSRGALISGEGQSSGSKSDAKTGKTLPAKPKSKITLPKQPKDTIKNIDKPQINIVPPDNTSTKLDTSKTNSNAKIKIKPAK
jgi:antitoxin component YwqK of YwqJK toxin-antitoxin module